MKQILQYLKNGKTEVVEVPSPVVRPGSVLVQTACSLVSAGTERMVVEFAEKNLVGKARSRPDLVRQMIDKARREGLIPTLEAAFNRLDQPMALGYSSSGIVRKVGEGVHEFKPGDRVACAGGGYAVHAEFAVVPKNLVVKLSNDVDFEAAAFTTLGAIAMHGFRLGNPQVGERVAIIGLGLLGMLAGQIAAAAGCRVLGVDVNPARVALGRRMGLTSVHREMAEETCRTWSEGRGCDVVLICADTKSNDPVELAGILARDRGKIVAVGAVGIDIPRKLYYDKELTFQVSRSYGPGRYDPQYEEKGLDYPVGYVRWSEGRNLESFQDLLAQKKINVQPLISHRFPIDQGPLAYELITGKMKEDFLGVLIQYPQLDLNEKECVQLRPPLKVDQPNATIGVGVLGAGLYANGVFLPIIKKSAGVRLVGIASASGSTARHSGGKFGFAYAASDPASVIQDDSIQACVILTRHASHTGLVIKSLQAGKAVYCEKPLAINRTQLSDLEKVLSESSLPLLMVGFNRRFAPLSVQLKQSLSVKYSPMVIQYRVNAGYLPLTHWLHDPLQGGGRIIGEACHFIDFAIFLAGETPSEVITQALPDQGRFNQDNVVITLCFPNGSIATLSYLANGEKRLPKERIEVFCDGTAAILDDFRRLELYQEGKNIIRINNNRQDKGHTAAWKAFITCLQTQGVPPIPYHELIGATEASFAAVESLQSGVPVKVQV